LHWRPIWLQFQALEWLIKYYVCVKPAAFLFFWGPSLVPTWYSRNGAVWRKHCTCTFNNKLDFCCTLSVMLVSLELLPSHIWSCRVLLFFLLVLDFLLEVEEKCFRMCNVIYFNQSNIFNSHSIGLNVSRD